MIKSISLLLLIILTAFTNSYAVHEPVSYDRTVIQNGSSVSLHKKNPASEKLTWFKKFKVKVVDSQLKKLSAPLDGEITTTKKLLSIISLVSGAAAMVLLLVTIAKVSLIATAAALITGFIALSGNQSKKHKNMARIGIMLGVVALAVLVIALITLFAGLSSL